MWVTVQLRSTDRLLEIESMPKDKNEVREFAQEVGAEEPEEGTEFYLQWRMSVC